MSKKFCPNCGNENPDFAKFCSSCGSVFPTQEPVAVPVVETPAMEAPVVEAPVVEAPVVETPVVEAPVVETPVVEAPVVETPVVEAPIVEAPVVEAPVVEAPVAEPPVMAPPVMPPVAAEPAPTISPKQIPLAANPIAPPQANPPKKSKKKEKPIKEKKVKEKPVKEKKAAPAKKKAMGAGRYILAVLLCMAIFFNAFVGLTIFAVRGMLEADTIEEIADQIDLSTIPATTVFPDADKKTMLDEQIVLFTEQEYAGKIALDKEKLNKFVEDSTFKTSLAAFLGDGISSLLDGDSSGITKDDIVTFLRNNETFLTEEFNMTQTPEEIADDLTSKIDLDNLSLDTLKDKNAAVYYTAKFGLSYITAGVFLFLSLVYAVLLFIVCKRRITTAVSSLGVTATVFGGLFTIPALVVLIAPSLLDSIFNSFIISLAVSQILNIFLLPCAITLAAGILLLVVVYLIRKFMAKRAAKAAATE